MSQFVRKTCLPFLYPIVSYGVLIFYAESHGFLLEMHNLMSYTLLNCNYDKTEYLKIDE